MFQAVVEVKTRLRLAKLLLDHCENLKTAQSILERAVCIPPPLTFLSPLENYRPLDFVLSLDFVLPLDFPSIVPGSKLNVTACLQLEI